MKQLTGASSVPRVFIGGSCIGGGDETSAAHRSVASLVSKRRVQYCYQYSTLIMIISRSGKLEGMLKEAGALL